MTKKFEFSKYKELLEKAIGHRTQKDFAEKAGISPYALSRTLGGEERRPRLDTLKKIAAASEGRVTETQLLHACGYAIKGCAGSIKGDRDDEKSSIVARASGLKKAIESLSGHANKYDTIASMLDTATILGSSEDRLVRFKSSIEKDFDGAGHRGAEKYLNITATWRERKFDSTLAFTLFFCKTEGSGYIISDCAFDLETLWDLNHKTAQSYVFDESAKGNLVMSEHDMVILIKEHVPTGAEKRLLKAIFGEKYKD